MYVPLAGLTNIKTRLSACCSFTSSPARRRLGLMSSYRQMCGIAVGFGRGGFSLFICFQRGFVCSFSTFSSRACSSCAWSERFECVAVCVADILSYLCYLKVIVVCPYCLSLLFSSPARFKLDSGYCVSICIPTVINSRGLRLTHCQGQRGYGFPCRWVSYNRSRICPFPRILGNADNLRHV